MHIIPLSPRSFALTTTMMPEKVERHDLLQTDLCHNPPAIVSYACLSSWPWHVQLLTGAAAVSADA